MAGALSRAYPRSRWLACLAAAADARYRQLCRVTKRVLLTNRFVPEDLLGAYRSTVSQALLCVHRCCERAGSVGALRLHGDCHGRKVFWTDARELYLIEVLRTLYLIHYAAWIERR